MMISITLFKIKNMKTITEQIPSFIFDIIKQQHLTKTIPNVIQTKNIDDNGLNALTNKNNFYWQSSIYNDKAITHNEGLIRWGGSSSTYVYFIKSSDTQYKVFILTYIVDEITLLLTGLDKFFID